MGAEITKFASSPEFTKMVEYSFYLVTNTPAGVDSDFVRDYISFVSQLLTELGVRHQTVPRIGAIYFDNTDICVGNWTRLTINERFTYCVGTRLEFLMDLCCRVKNHRAVIAKIAERLPQPIAEEICEYLSQTTV